MQKFIKGMTSLQFESLTTTNPEIFWLVPIGAPVLFLLRGIGDYMSNVLPGLRRAARSSRRIRGDLFRQYLHLPASYYDRASGGMMLSRLTFNIEQVAEATTKSITSLIRDSLTIVVLIGSMFYFSWQLAMFVFLIAPPLSWLVRKVSSSFRRYSARIQASMGDVTRVVKEALDGQRVIKVFNAQTQEAADFEKVNEHNRRSNMKLIAARATSNPVVQFIASLGAGRHPVGGDAPDRRTGTLALGDVHGISHRAADDHRAAASDSWIPSCRSQQGVAAGASVFEVLDSPSEDFNVRPRARARRGRGRVPRREFRIRGGEGRACCTAVSLAGAGRARTIAIVGRSGQRQVHARRAGAAHLRRALPARCSSTASTCATATCATCARTSRS